VWQSLQELKKQYQEDVRQLHEHQNQHDPIELLATLCGLHTAMTPTASYETINLKRIWGKDEVLLIDDIKQKPVVHECKDQPMTSRPTHAVH
jgi:hypothetical protein